jgi:NADPH:quinone reductase-like Zn-dependent oxidoreductase
MTDRSEMRYLVTHVVTCSTAALTDASLETSWPTKVRPQLAASPDASRLGAHVATTASASNAAWLRELGANVVVDYRTEDFTHRRFTTTTSSSTPSAGRTPFGHSRCCAGGIAISIGGPPDPAFARQLGKPILRPVMALISRKVRAVAKKRGVRYSFLFMQANGSQLQRITALVEAGALKPVVDSVFAFDDAVAALDHVSTGRARGKVVLEMP